VKLRKPSILVIIEFHPVFPFAWKPSILVIIEFHPVFPFAWAPPVLLHIFSLAPTCTATTIITLKPCALNAEFQHFIRRFNQNSLLCGYDWKRGLGVKGGPKTG
jgi:hypothetical protein